MVNIFAQTFVNIKIFSTVPHRDIYFLNLAGEYSDQTWQFTKSQHDPNEIIIYSTPSTLVFTFLTLLLQTGGQFWLVIMII